MNPSSFVIKLDATLFSGSHLLRVQFQPWLVKRGEDVAIGPSAIRQARRQTPGPLLNLDQLRGIRLRILRPRGMLEGALVRCATLRSRDPVEVCCRSTRTACIARRAGAQQAEIVCAGANETHLRDSADAIVRRADVRWRLDVRADSIRDDIVAYKATRGIATHGDAVRPSLHRPCCCTRAKSGRAAPGVIPVVIPLPASVTAPDATTTLL